MSRPLHIIALHTNTIQPRTCLRVATSLVTHCHWLITCACKVDRVRTRKEWRAFPKATCMIMSGWVELNDMHDETMWCDRYVGTNAPRGWSSQGGFEVPKEVFLSCVLSLCHVFEAWSIWSPLWIPFNSRKQWNEWLGGKAYRRNIEAMFGPSVVTCSAPLKNQALSAKLGPRLGPCALPPFSITVLGFLGHPVDDAILTIPYQCL